MDSTGTKIEPNHTRDKETFSTALHGVASKYTLLHNLGKAQKEEGYEWTHDGEWYRTSKKSALPITTYRKVCYMKQEYKGILQWNTHILQMPCLQFIYIQIRLLQIQICCYKTHHTTDITA